MITGKASCGNRYIVLQCWQKIFTNRLLGGYPAGAAERTLRDKVRYRGENGVRGSE
jgi:hypothetical protein